MPDLPTLADLITQCLEVREIALGYTREYKDRNGNTKSCPAPDGRTALAATELMAKLLGHLGATGAGTMTKEQAQKELAALGLRRVK